MEELEEVRLHSSAGIGQNETNITNDHFDDQEIKKAMITLLRLENALIACTFSDSHRRMTSHCRSGEVRLAGFLGCFALFWLLRCSSQALLPSSFPSPSQRTIWEFSCKCTAMPQLCSWRSRGLWSPISAHVRMQALLPEGCLCPKKSISWGRLLIAVCHTLELCLSRTRGGSTGHQNASLNFCTAFSGTAKLIV